MIFVMRNFYVDVKCDGKYSITYCKLKHDFEDSLTNVIIKKFGNLQITHHIKF